MIHSNYSFCSENVVCKEKCKTQRENILDHKSLFACLSYLKVNDKVPSSKLFFKCVSFYKWIGQLINICVYLKYRVMLNLCCFGADNHDQAF